MSVDKYPSIFCAKWRLLFIYTMMAKPMKTLELHYPMIQFLIIIIMNHFCSNFSSNAITYLPERVFNNLSKLIVL